MASEVTRYVHRALVGAGIVAVGVYGQTLDVAAVRWGGMFLVSAGVFRMLTYELEQK